MKNIKTAATAAAMAAVMAGAAVGADNDKDKAVAAALGFPSLFVSTSPDLQRFADASYYRTLAADGIKSSDPKALYARIAAATQAGENYKALYLSRIFTLVQPANSTGWENRASFATALGFEAEAAGARANAASTSPAPLSGGALPGSFKVRPTTLSDWAAALAMVADDTTAREGRATVVAVADNLSGVDVPSNAAIEESGRGPWVDPKPVQVEDVLTNLFTMPQATPMDRKSMKGGLFALGALAMAGSAYSSATGVASTAAQLAQVSGNVMAHAFEVPSELKGGTFVSVTYANGVAKPTTIKPKTAGKYEAVGTPLPMLWASGPSLSSSVQAQWRSGDTSKSEAIRIDGKTKKQEWKKYELAAMTYPRMQRFCDDARRCSPMLTLLEVMLTADDLRALAPGTETRLPSLSAWTSRYNSRTGMTLGAAGDRFTGFDAAGTVYITRHRPTEWLVTAAAPAIAKK